MSFRVVFAFAALFATLVPAAAAEPSATPEANSVRAGVREACAADVKALCGDVQPGGGKILRCLKEHKAQVSSGCKEAAAAMRAARKNQD